MRNELMLIIALVLAIAIGGCAATPTAPPAAYQPSDIAEEPDDIGGVYFDNDSGLFAFLLVNPTPERIAELRALAGHDLIITPSTYSYNELRRIQDEIWAEVGADITFS